MKDLQGTFATKVSIGPHDTKSIFNSQEHKSILRNSVSVRIQLRNRFTYLTAVSVRNLTQSRATLSTDADSKRLRECAHFFIKTGRNPQRSICNSACLPSKLLAGRQRDCAELVQVEGANVSVGPRDERVHDQVLRFHRLQPSIIQ